MRQRFGFVCCLPPPKKNKNKPSKRHRHLQTCPANRLQINTETSPRPNKIRSPPNDALLQKCPPNWPDGFQVPGQLPPYVLIKCRHQAHGELLARGYRRLSRKAHSAAVNKEVSLLWWSRDILQK